MVFKEWYSKVTDLAWFQEQNVTGKELSQMKKHRCLLNVWEMKEKIGLRGV